MSRLNLSVKLIFDDKSFLINPPKPMFFNCIYNHRTTKTNQKYPSVNL